ncbi:MAG TPA: protein kinase [Labilithrix sp.]|nr:protein kinase [Labilithrix sp.]
MNASKLDDSEMPEAHEALGLELIDESELFYVSIGDVVADKYRIDGVLGVGGMGFVLSAKHVDLEQWFALKFLNEQFLREKALIERFTQEAKAACRIRSEHVARVYDVGVHQGAPFLVMEHLNGRDLATVVAESGALRIHDAVEYTMQACEALADAHRQGIVHRDIKPENLFLVEHEGLPSIKVLDFGISKTVLTGADQASRLTGELTLGTPCYMSPEQIRSTATADARSDLWSLGVVLYELLSGKEAFRAASVTGVCAAVLEEDPEPLWRLRPEIPRELAEVVAKCLAKDPAERYANVAELAVALLPFAPARALVSAERSSSLMRTARDVGGRERHISSVRPSKQASRSRSGEVEPAPASDAPFSRSIEAEGVVEPRSVRRAPALVALAIAAVLGVLGVLAYPATRTVVQANAPPAAEHLEAVAAPSASTPVAVRAAPAAALSVDEPPTAVGAAKRNAAPPPRARATESASAHVVPSAHAVPSSTASSTRATPSAATSARTAPSVSATVELGY